MKKWTLAFKCREIYRLFPINFLIKICFIKICLTSRTYLSVDPSSLNILENLKIGKTLGDIL